MTGIRGDRREALAGDRPQQRPDEQRVAAGRAEARLDERALRLAPELLLGELHDRVDTERRRPDQDRRRVGDELREQLVLLALLGRP